MDAPTRMQLERVVDALEAQPWNREVPAQHATAYKYLRTLAQEISSINKAHVGAIASNGMGSPCAVWPIYYPQWNHQHMHLCLFDVTCRGCAVLGPEPRAKMFFVKMH